MNKKNLLKAIALVTQYHRLEYLNNGGATLQLASLFDSRRAI